MRGENLARLKDCMRRAEAGEELTLGGTTSHYGVSRVVTDLLMYQPDFAVVDFSVNDEPDVFFQETYEGLIRRILSWPSKPAVLILNNVFYDTGKSAQTRAGGSGNRVVSGAGEMPNVGGRNGGAAAFGNDGQRL